MKKSELLVEGKRRAPGLVLRGLCMGAADVIPGVSGGTIALITGIYDELVGTIAAVDQRLVSALVRGRLIEVLHRVNAPFLVPLLLGIGLAIASLAKFITWLLATHPQPVWGFFTGLILASALVVARQVAGWGPAQWGLTALGAVVGYAITTLVPVETGVKAVVVGFNDMGEPITTLVRVETGVEGYKFVLAGMVAICAMILPGISGSFLLVVMGKYRQVLTAVHEFDLTILALFGAGAVIGLLGFSRLLKHLLARFRAGTMAFLVGLMLGSLRKVWPFRNELEDGRYECTWPQEFNGEAWLSLGLIAVGVVLVLVLERLGRRR